MQNAAPKG